VKLSLVIPCFNEADNLAALVQRCAGALGEGVEFILVDNGSTDDTADRLPALIADHPGIRSLRLADNAGYGGGILAGLAAGTGDVLGWTHADGQTDPHDAMAALPLAGDAFVKGQRGGRPLRDVVFTWGMAAVEFGLLGTAMWDINGQPTLFPRAFYEGWVDPPTDFSLDLFAYQQAVQQGLPIRRIPVTFGPRLSGEGHNETLAAKLRYSRRTLAYSVQLRRRLRARR